MKAALPLRERLIELVDANTDETGSPNGALSAYALAIAAARMALEDAERACDTYTLRRHIRALAKSLDHEGMGNG